jgi:succinoglycan biosynthesis transport protein ExoP
LSPLAPVIDVRATVNLIDCYVFVIEWGKTKMEVVSHVLGSAKSVHHNILTAVLNRASVNLLARFDGSRKDYYKNKHYGRYGYTK